tara:strand:- start:264 stop:467 length:204 start_codon:yes stop_codon:yes gene_type:complete
MMSRFQVGRRTWRVEQRERHGHHFSLFCAQSGQSENKLRATFHFPEPSEHERELMRASSLRTFIKDA